MLRNQNDIFRSRGLDGAHPLIRIEVRRRKYFRIGSTVSPFAVEESVRAEMNDDAKFEVLPFDLLRRRLKIDEVLSLREWLYRK